MNKIPFMGIKVNQIIPKRRDTIDNVIGNSFTMSLPFHDLPYIEDKTADMITFQSISVIPGDIFNNKGKLELLEEGVKTRAVLTMDLKGLLLRMYLFHWLPAFFLWMFQGLWVSLINQSAMTLVQDWVIAVLLFWPFILFLFLRRRVKLRMMAYVNNLKFH